MPDRLAFLGVVGAAGEHHVHHARGADEARQAHRAAAADEDAAACPRAARNRPSVFGHPDVAGAPRAPARRRPRRRAAPRPPAPCRTRCARRRDASCANARCPARRCARSARRDRGRRRNGRPRRASTTALTPSGTASKKASIPNTVGSSSALRFSGRARSRTAMSPWRSALSDRGSRTSKPLPDLPTAILKSRISRGFGDISPKRGQALTPLHARRAAPRAPRARRSRAPGCG